MYRVLKIFVIFFLFFNLYLFAKDKKKILILHSYHQSLKWSTDINKGINSILTNEDKQYEFYYEYMDTKRFVDKRHFENLFNLYSNKYQIMNLDLIIASDHHAFNFLKKYKDSLFSDVPIIISGINYLKKEDIEHLNNFIGINEQSDIKENYDLIIKLHPNVKKIYTIIETTTTGETIKQEARRVIKNYKNKNIEFEIIDDKNYNDLKSFVKNLPKDSVILLTIYFRDKDGNFFTYYDISRMISKNSMAPLYGLWDFNLDNGIIGGYLISAYFQGISAAKKAKKILEGTNIKDIPNQYKSPNNYMFDYKQIKRYKINEKLIPKNSYIINKKISFYENYKTEIISIIVIFIILIIFIILLLINITKRKKAEIRIKKQLKFQQELIDNVNTPIYYKNKEKVFIGCNKAFEKLINKKSKEIIGNTTYNLFSKKNADFFTKMDDKLLKNQSLQKFETSYEFEDRVSMDAILYKNVFFDEGEVVGIIGVIFDITELKKVSNDLEELNRNLEEEVKLRTIELKRTNEELEDSNEELQTMIHNLKTTQDKLIESEKMASLGSLVAGVAHEINTPIGIGLTGITHFIEESSTLNNDYKNEEMTEEKFNKFLENTDELSQLIKKNLERTAQLVKSFKQVAVDQTSDIKREVNLKEYISEVLFSLNNITKKTNIDINVMGNDNIKIETYPGSISQIITNLIINSIRHGFKEKEKGIINIEITYENEKIRLIYTDSGRGIKKENLNKIFDPFFTTNREEGGTGLGLNIIYNIITTTLQGTIECNSEENKGVEFIISFNAKNLS